MGVHGQLLTREHLITASFSKKIIIMEEVNNSETHNINNMGNSSSSPRLNKGPIQGQIGSMGTLRTHTTRRPPMPDENEIGVKFKQLQQLPLTKKWEMICDQEQVTARDPPSEYLNKLKIYLDPNKDKMSKNLKTLGNNTSTQVLRDLEISLRTNNIEWVREFLSPQCNGLDTLIEYLTTRLC